MSVSGQLPPNAINDESAHDDYSTRVIRASAAPGCYLDTASAHKEGQISSLEFFQRVLRHLGPLETRVRHPDDDRPLFLNPLFWKGRFGPVAAAIKLCESDPLAASAKGMSLHFAVCEASAYTIITDC